MREREREKERERERERERDYIMLQAFEHGMSTYVLFLRQMFITHLYFYILTFAIFSATEHVKHGKVLQT